MSLSLISSCVIEAWRLSPGNMRSLCGQPVAQAWQRPLRLSCSMKSRAEEELRAAALEKALRRNTPCQPSTGEVEAGGSGAQDHPLLECEAILSYVRLCFKHKTTKFKYVGAWDKAPWESTCLTCARDPIPRTEKEK